MRKALHAAAFGCGIFFAALAVAQPVTPAAAGTLPAATMQRLLITDAERFGNRIVAVGDRGYIVITDDYGARWKRASRVAEFR